MRDDSAPVVALGYLRVSTAEQTKSGLGLDAQRDAITTYAAARGWSVEILADEGKSGSQINPGLEEALGRLRSGQANALIVAKMDRLARSVKNAADIIDRAQRQHWRLVVCDADIDLGTPAGEAWAHMLSIFAAFERKLIGARIREALAVKSAKGERVGRSSAIPAGTLRRIVMEHNAGASFGRVAADLTADDIPTPTGLTVWQPSTVRRAYTSAMRKAVA